MAMAVGARNCFGPEPSEPHWSTKVPSARNSSTRLLKVSTT
jgi:hypothetical protein